MAKASKKSGVKKKSSAKKTTTKKGGTTKIKYESTKEIRVERALIENFIGLQKVMVNLSAKFDDLATQISKLLDLFEISAKSLARKDADAEKENREIKDILGKLDVLSQQTGLIGKGLALMHESNYGMPAEIQRQPVMQMRPSEFPAPKKLPSQEFSNMEDSQKSILHSKKEF